MIATLVSKNLLIRFSHAAKKGDAIIHANAGKTKKFAKRRLSQTAIFSPARFSDPAKYASP